MESVGITPEPDDAERAAILKALADEAEEGTGESEWADALLPTRGGENDEP